jgi:hypothetical protein
MDSVGKFKVRGTYGSVVVKYAVGIVDDATGYRWYFVLKSLTHRAPLSRISGIRKNLTFLSRISGIRVAN